MKQESNISISESKIIIEVLCNQRWDKQWVDHFNPKLLMVIAQKNKIMSSIAFHVIKGKLAPELKNTSFYSSLKESYMLNLRDIEAYKQVLKLLGKVFTENKIEFCLLKGLSIPLKIPRDLGDLDLLIHQKDLIPAIELLEKLGFKYQGYDRNIFIKKREFRKWDKLVKWSNQFEFLHPKTGLLVELHTNLFERFRVYKFDMTSILDQTEEIWKRIKWSDSLQCYELSREDKLWLTSIHNSIKRTATKNTFAFRNLLDLKAIIESGEIKWNKLLQQSKESSTLIYLIYSLEMTQRFHPELNLSDPIERGNQLLKKREIIFKKLMHKCYFDLNTSSYSGMILIRFLTPFIMKSSIIQKIRSCLVFPILFHPPWRLRQIYNLPKGSVLVLFTYFIEPLRWVRIAMRKK